MTMSSGQADVEADSLMLLLPFLSIETGLLPSNMVQMPIVKGGDFAGPVDDVGRRGDKAFACTSQRMS